MPAVPSWGPARAPPLSFTASDPCTLRCFCRRSTSRRSARPISSTACTLTTASPISTQPCLPAALRVHKRWPAPGGYHLPHLNVLRILRLFLAHDSHTHSSCVLVSQVQYRNQRLTGEPPRYAATKPAKAASSQCPRRAACRDRTSRCRASVSARRRAAVSHSQSPRQLSKSQPRRPACWPREPCCDAARLPGHACRSLHCHARTLPLHAPPPLKQHYPRSVHLSL